MPCDGSAPPGREICSVYSRIAGCAAAQHGRSPLQNQRSRTRSPHSPNLKHGLTENVILPVSELNRMRRALVERLDGLRSQPKRWELRGDRHGSDLVEPAQTHALPSPPTDAAEFSNVFRTAFKGSSEQCWTNEPAPLPPLAGRQCLPRSRNGGPDNGGRRGAPKVPPVRSKSEPPDWL